MPLLKASIPKLVLVVGLASMSISIGSVGASETEPSGFERGYVHGAVDKRIVWLVVQERLPQFESCRREREDIQEDTRLHIEFAIGKDGKVLVVAANADSTPHAGLARCATKVMRRWTFPRPRSGVAFVMFSVTIAPTMGWGTP